jgi:hypothetical protein
MATWADKAGSPSLVAGSPRPAVNGSPAPFRGRKRTSAKSRCDQTVPAVAVRRVAAGTADHLTCSFSVGLPGLNPGPLDPQAGRGRWVLFGVAGLGSSNEVPPASSCGPVGARRVALCEVSLKNALTPLRQDRGIPAVVRVLCAFSPVGSTPP